MTQDSQAAEVEFEIRAAIENLPPAKRSQALADIRSWLNAVSGSYGKSKFGTLLAELGLPIWRLDHARAAALVKQMGEIK